MSRSLLWRAILAQTVTVGGLFALLLALPLPRSLFREQGAWIGPLSWLLCALVAGAAIGLTIRRAVAAAAVSGVAAAAVSVSLGHSSGMMAGVIAFGLTGALGARGGAARIERPSSSLADGTPPSSG